MPCGNSRALEEEERPLLLLGKDSADERPRISVYCSLHNFLFLSIIFFFPSHALWWSYMWITKVADPEL